jgi:hypothetical protein
VVGRSVCVSVGIGNTLWVADEFSNGQGGGRSLEHILIRERTATGIERRTICSSAVLNINAIKKYINQII